jgi:phosphoglycerate dehydrogenase-like enzyme
MNILFAAPQSAWSGFIAKFAELNPEHQISSQDDFRIKTLAGFDVLIPTMSRVTASHIATADRLKLIQQMGSGLESVDVEAAESAEIMVANVPTADSGNADSVAELGIYLMIGLARNALQMRQNIRRGVIGNPFGLALKGKTVGIIGLGGIGAALIDRLKPFGMRIYGIKRHQPDEAKVGLGSTGVVHRTNYRCYSAQRIL